MANKRSSDSGPYRGYRTEPSSTSQGDKPRRSYDGECNPNAKLTWQDVFEIRIRKENGEQIRDLAKGYGISFVACWHICINKAWRVDE